MSELSKASYKLAFPKGRPVILENGKPISPAAYCDCILHKDEWIARNRDFVESGVPR